MKHGNCMGVRGIYGGGGEKQGNILGQNKDLLVGCTVVLQQNRWHGGGGKKSIDDKMFLV